MVFTNFKKILMGITLAGSVFALPTLSLAEKRGFEAFYPSSLRDYNVANCYTFVSGSAFSYAGMVEEAKSDWSRIPAANVKFHSAGSATNADVRVYAGNYGLDYAGIIQPFYNGGYPVEDPYDFVGNWEFVTVAINDNYMSHYNYSNTNKRKTVIHEFGHVLAMAHQDSFTESIMKQGQLNYTDPTSLDIENIQFRY